MKKMKKIRLSSIIALSVGIGFIVFGIFREEIVTVLEKGIKLCLECVGIG